MANIATPVPITAMMASAWAFICHRSRRSFLFRARTDLPIQIASGDSHFVAHLAGDVIDVVTTVAVVREAQLLESLDVQSQGVLA